MTCDVLDCQLGKPHPLVHEIISVDKPHSLVHEIISVGKPRPLVHEIIPVDKPHPLVHEMGDMKWVNIVKFWRLE